MTGETPPSFIKRIYGEWLGQGLTRADLRGLDGQLYGALSHYLRTAEMPKDVDLPTLKEQNDRWVRAVRERGTSALPNDPRLLSRLGFAMKRRENQL